MLERGRKGKAPAGGSVRPGQHVPALGSQPVVWWDPAVLALQVDELASLRHQRILEADSAAAADSERKYAEWKAERKALLAEASEPSMLIQTVTSLVRLADGRDATEGTASDAEPRVDVERIESGDPKRPGGRRFGTLVHEILASIDLKADAAAVAAVASVHGRIVGAGAEEISAAIATVVLALKHPILRRAARVQTGNLRRETPVMLTLEDGRLVEGVIDLAFREDTSEFAGWTVVDFKTDREFDETSDRYIAQVRAYSRAVAGATSVQARGVLLVI